MLLLMMEVKGRFNGKMIKKAKFGDVYFDEMGGFQSVEKDRLTGAVSNLITPRRKKEELSADERDIYVGRIEERSHLETITRSSCEIDAARVCENGDER